MCYDDDEQEIPIWVALLCTFFVGMAVGSAIKQWQLEDKIVVEEQQ